MGVKMSTEISTEQVGEDISPGSDFSRGLDFDNNNNNNNNNNSNNNEVRIVCGDLNTNIKREMNKNPNKTTTTNGDMYKNSRTTKNKNYYYYRHGGFDRSHPESICIPDGDVDEPLTTDDQFVGECGPLQQRSGLHTGWGGGGPVSRKEITRV